MKKVMKNITIESITIKNFRSIRNIKIDASNLNIFVGLNDVGKSNVIKSLNLFFNGQTDYNTQFNFNTDFSYLFPTGSHGTKEITISIVFAFPDTYKGDRKYVWEKKWRTNGSFTEKIVTPGGKKPGKKSKIVNALSRIKFRYVPAVKSRDYFRSLLVELYSAISSSLNSPLKESIESFSNVLRDYTFSINQEVTQKLQLHSELTFPEDLKNVFSDLIFITKSEKDNLNINLEYRGDGIQARHIPIILQYIADEDQKSRNGGTTRITTIWGFEEPENGVELLKAFELSEEFKSYSNKIQIFMTTHSPAFYMIKDQKDAIVFHVEKNNGDGATIIKKSPDQNEITHEMGLMPLVAPFIAEKEKEIRELKNLSLINHIEKNTIIVEGITDKYYIDKAIGLYSDKLKKAVASGDVIVFSYQGNGGCTNVARIMKSYIVGLNKGMKVAILDKDAAALSSKNEINDFKKQFSSSENISVIQIEPSEEIKNLYHKGINLPFCIEHLLSQEVWKIMIERNLVNKRTSKEILDIFSNKMDENKSVSELKDSLELPDYVDNIISYVPNPDSKSKIKALVESMFKANPDSTVLCKLEPTIKRIEEKFSKILK